MSRLFEKHLISVIFGFIGAVFAIVGGGLFWGGYDTQQQLEQTKQMPPYTATQLTSLPSGTLVGVEGRISEQNNSHNSGLVIYTVHEYKGYECDDEGCEEQWNQLERVSPALWLDLADGRVRVSNTNYLLLRPPESFKTTTTLIEDTTLSYTGYRITSQAYVVGKIDTEDGLGLEADFFYGGTYEEYLIYQAEEAWVLKLIGAIFIGFGLLFMTIALIVGLFINR